MSTVRGSASFRQAEKKILDKIIGKGVYDPRIRPSGANATFDGGNFLTILFKCIRN